MGIPTEPGVYGVVGGGKEQSPMAKRMSEARGQELNDSNIRLFDLAMDPDLQRPPDYYLYIFNTVDRRFEIRHPPGFPLISIPPCPKGKPWVRAVRIPNIVREKFLDENNVARSNPIFGERFATDLLNPDNLGIDIWQELTAEQMAFSGNGSNDLVRRGLFWSKNEVPTKEELAKSKAKLEMFYRGKLRQADMLARNPKTADQIAYEHLLAAEYFNYRASWFTVAELPSLCPNCGEEIKPGVAYHRNSMDGLCVIDYRRAVNANVVKLADVPKDMRWE